jgi:phage terminase small subunit
MAKSKENDNNNLTDKQELFCQEYIIDLNATKAAQRAGYSRKTAYSEGSRLLKNVEIRTRIAELMDERSKRTLVDQDFVVNSLLKVHERCMQQVPVMIFDPVKKALVQKKEEVEDEEGNVTAGGVYEFDSNGANRSLELLGKHLAMFTDKTDNKHQVTEIKITRK